MVSAQSTEKKLPGDPKKLFGDRLRVLRQEAGISQEELADRSGIDRTYVSGVERGRRNVCLENICRLSLALNTTPSVLLTGVVMEVEDV